MMAGIAMSESFKEYVRELRRRWPSQLMDQPSERRAAESRGEKTEPRSESAIIAENTTRKIMSEHAETDVERQRTERLNERYR